MHAFPFARLLTIVALSFAWSAGGCAPSAPSPPPAVQSPVEPAKVDPATTSLANDSDSAEPAGSTLTRATQTAAVTGAETVLSDGPVLLGSPELTAGIPGEGPLELAEIQAWLDEPRHHEPLQFDLPLGLDAGRLQVKGLDENPFSRAKIELGRQLFFDARLSADSSISCSSCHDPDQGYAAHTQFGVGVGQQTGNRNSPVAYNRILSDKQFWDGRAGSLEEQALGPIANPIEMSNTHEACVACLKGIEGYRLQFERIFGELTIEAVAQAIASFERAVVTGPAPFDFYERLRTFEALGPDVLADLEEDDPEAYTAYRQAQAEADEHPMSESARRGRELFFTDKGGCTGCHVGPNLSDEQYHNLGVGMEAPMPDLGRYELTGEDKDRGAFKTPTIRNVALTAPYMHDGSQKSLEEVVEWYNKGGHPNPYLSSKIKKLSLTDEEKQDLVEFMKACTGELPRVERGRLP